MNTKLFGGFAHVSAVLAPTILLTLVKFKLNNVPEPDSGVEVDENAEMRNVFCNVADVPELCSFILPAVHREGPITIAVSTGGASPALAQWIRSRIAELVGPEHARIAEQLRELRPWAKRNLPTYEDRRDYFQRLVERALS